MNYDVYIRFGDGTLIATFSDPDDANNYIVSLLNDIAYEIVIE